MIYDWINYGAGMVYMNKKLFNKAENTFNSILKNNPHFGLAFAQLGFIRKNQGKKKESIQLFKKAIKSIYQDETGTYQCGLLYIECGDFKNAFNQFSKVLNFNTSNVDAVADCAYVLGRKGQIEKASELISNIYGNDQNIKDCYAKLCRVKADQRDWAGALEIAKKDEKLDRLTPWWRTQLAELYGRQGDFKHAQMLIDQSYQENDSIYDAYTRLGLIKADERDWAGALEIAKKDEAISRLTPWWRTQLAELYGRQGDFEHAQMLIEQFYQENNSIYDAYARLGLIKEDEKNKPGALEKMKKDEELNRLTSWWRTMLSQLSGRAGKIEQTIIQSKLSNRQDSDLLDGFVRIGKAMMTDIDNTDWNKIF